MTDELVLLRGLAQDERDAIIEGRVRRGEDPAIVVAETPEVDDFVVKMLRDDQLDARGLMAEYTLARLAQHDGRADAEAHRRSTDALDAEIYRSIGIAYPALTRAVWRALASVSPAVTEA